ncbi:MAG: hypothetical protein COU35_04435 [Candidatus Magasanikbacteria bacterium CG10_big_fil_rev_8_21_14_0_10_47_10]|uniref:DUF1573 domain-containing protein n=1 Tax=Candidatus Magasanikbacteria bacterium CG10_big_fil_rev_8_21_14_0_10_47_10 TaxID=1974652 RepID=A0A2H0TPI8_9BACT|nr:MAG: hypothetical protein COU35_04435 [Candidatus Magasanikbacteria bacterium CG10_big_fil_rev_8_21_14_0_10_47_10]
MKVGLTILGIGILVIGLAKMGASTSAGQTTASPIRSSSALTESAGTVNIEQNNLDLGDIPIGGGTVNATFYFTNTGDEPIVLTSGKTSCMCTEAVVTTADGAVSPKILMQGHGSSGVLDMVVASGERASVVATFDPMAHGPNALGPITRDVILATNSKTHPDVRFTFRGNVVKE